jgi:hypothetical protein
MNTFTAFTIRMQFESDPTLAFVASERVDAAVLASVIQGGAFVEFCVLDVRVINHWMTLRAWPSLKKSSTVHEDGRKAGLLHRVVRHELDPHLVAGRFDVLRNGVAAVDADQRAVGLVTVANFQIIVDAIIVILDFKRLKLERHLVVYGHGNLPRALLVGLVIIREVGRLQVSGFHVQISSAQS